MTLARPEHPPVDPVRVLVAEDNRLNCLLIEEQLRVLGWAPAIVTSGREALQRWRSGSFAAVLTDLNMPDMDGYALAAAIRAEERTGTRIPIVALTADAFQAKSDRWRIAGIDGYLTKPLDLATLKAALDRWLGLAAGAHEQAVAKDEPEQDEPVDPVVLARIVGDNPAGLSKFIVKFGHAAEEALARLQAARAAGRRDEVGSLAHQLKASAAAVGATKLNRACEAIESAALAEDDMAPTAAWGALGTEMDRVRRWIATREANAREVDARPAAP
jgi:two-component system sensor histidine kinase/response regulator